MSPELRPVVFLTDFGYEDEFMGVCRAVLERISPGVRVIDLTHGIQPGDLRRGAMALAAAVDYSPPAVFLAVVDPGVGTARRAVALQAGDHFFVGPDNGLLSLAAYRAGGVTAGVEISSSPVRLEPTMRTFHGRDIFSPVAAALAAGKPLEELGEKINPGSPVRLELPVAEIGEGLVVATVLARDRYGNLMLNLGPEEIRQSFLAPGQAVAVEAGGAGSRAASRRVAFASAFGEVEAGEGLLYPDSSGSLALAVNRGDAARTFGLEADDRVRLSPA